MKYLVFLGAAAAMPFLGVLVSTNRKWMRWTFWAMTAALCAFQQTAINFCSNEWYRGSSRGMEVSVVYLLSFALLVALAMRGKFPGLFPGTGSKLYLLYFLLCLPSWTAAENRLFCWMETWKMLMLHVYYLAAYGYLKATDDVKGVCKALAGLVFWNFLLVARDHLHGVYQPNGIFPHQNGLAMAMHAAGGLFFAGYLLHGTKPAFGKMCLAAGVCAAGTTIRTYSRMAIALMPFDYSLVALFCATGGRLLRWGRRILPLALAGLLGLSLMLPRIVERFRTASSASKSTRVELARCAWEMMKDEPWRGVGINNWGIKINPPYEYAERAGRISGRGEDFRDGIVETVYLLVGAECGIPALLAMLAWFGYYLAVALLLVRRLRGTWYHFVPAGLAGGLAIVYGHSCFEWTLRMQQNLIVQLTFFALLEYLQTGWRKLRTPEWADGRRA